MWLALAALAAGEADAVVSAGNTGALMAMGLATVPPPPPIERPAFCTRVPTRAGHCYLLDLGANVDCSAEQLLQFGLMGAALAAISDSSVAPRVGLLNIGAEANKGNEQVRAAARLLEATPGLNYVGPVEGDALFDGVADVVVCDGFVGNVALKVCEGTASMIRDRLRARLRAGLTGRLAAMLLAPVLAPLFRELDPQRYAGAMLLGLGGVVVKSHGNSSEQSFQRAISYAASAVENGLVAAIGERLKDVFTSAKN